MNRLIILILSTTYLLFAATDAQIEKYLTLSTAEEQLLQLQSEFSAMQNSFSNKEEDTPYDMQLLSIRFKAYLKRHLSESEMDEVLQNYRNVAYLQLANASLETFDTNQSQHYLKSLQDDEEAQSRITLFEEINKALYKKEFIGVMFDELIKPLMQNGISGQKIDKKMMQTQKEAYVKAMIKKSEEWNTYILREFSIEDLEALLKVVKTPSVQLETKTVYAATAYALKAFFLSMASRYDVGKHQAKPAQ